MMATLLSRQAVIVLAIGAAVFVSLGSWLRFARKNRAKKMIASMLYLGYILFALSILIYIALGFLDR